MTSPTPRVRLVTAGRLHTPDVDQPLLAAALQQRGAQVDVAAWNDPAVDWSAADVTVIRSTWDYVTSADSFRRWLQTTAKATRLVNDADLVSWNVDKHYLRELAAAGVPIVPTTFVEPGERFSAPDVQEYVVKPAVGADSQQTGRFRGDDGRVLAEQVLAPADGSASRAVMVQPYLASVASAGEASLVYLGGGFSHAVRKTEALAFGGLDLTAEQFYAAVVPLDPGEEQLAVAAAALAALPGTSPPAYARVDLVADDVGTVRLMEVELVEPLLHLYRYPAAADRFAALLLNRGEAD